MLVPGLVDFGKCLVQSLLGGGQVGPQRLERPRLGGLLSLQLLAAFQHLQQGIFQTGLTALQAVELVLQISQLLGVRCTRSEQRPVPVATLTHRINLRLKTRHLAVQVLRRDSQGRHPVVGGVVLGLHLLVSRPLRQMGSPMRDPGQLSIQLRQFQ